MKFDNSYTRLPDDFFQRVAPVSVKQPGFIRLNRTLANEMELELPADETELATIFSGNQLLEGMDPIAQAYAGHQFGHFVPQLGDGRAVLLGEVVNSSGTRYDVQLKGSGQTRFSRNGDGRAPLGPVIREYIVSEAMHAFGVPTSRSLAMVTTGEDVFRETTQPGAVLTRVASSHIRVGTFEFFAARKNHDALKVLADHVIDRHYPEARDADNPYAALYEKVCHAQAELVAKWMGIGFIHGVMNTDNTTVSGETIDYGPCAFMDHYNASQVYSSIDHQGRYAYNNQPTIAQWNMASFGGSLVPLFHDDNQEAHKIGEAVIETFAAVFKEAYQKTLCRKIGLESGSDKDFRLVKNLLQFMEKEHADFTNAFRSIGAYLDGNTEQIDALFDMSNGFDYWLATWQNRLKEEGRPLPEVHANMMAVNPAFIPRNHRIEQAIRAAVDDGDLSLTHKLIDILKTPFDDQPENAEYMTPPQPGERVHQTFCGT